MTESFSGYVELEKGWREIESIVNTIWSFFVG